MCEECRKHKTDCTTLMLRRARPEQILRLLRDILDSDRDPGGSTA